MATATRRILLTQLGGACLAALIASWTSYYAFWPVRAWLPDALAATVAFAVGYGLVGWLLLPTPRRPGALGLGKPSALDLVCLLLLLPAYPLGVAVQALVRAALGVAPAPAGFDLPSATLLAHTDAGSLAAVFLFFVVSAIVVEWLFRGVLLAGVLERLGAWRSVLFVSVLSAAVFPGNRGPAGEWIAVAAAAYVWSVLLGFTRYATGSLWSAVLLHVGFAVQWGVTTLLYADDGGGWVPSGTAIAFCAVSVAAGGWLLRRRARDADTQGVQLFSQSTSVHEAAERRIRFPVVGIAVGAGVLVAECVAVFQTVLAVYSRFGLWKAFGGSLLLYATAGAALDVLMQLLLPRRFRGSPWLRALPVLALAVVVEHWAAGWAVGGFAVAPVAAVWAWTLRARWTRPLAAAMAACALLYAVPEPALPPPPKAVTGPRPDALSFIIVVLDTVRRDHCSLYGYDRRTTPVLEGLAKRGVRFDRAYANSCWSIDSHGSLLTGLLPHSHGATFEHTRLREDVPTLASTLAAHGYETAGFSANPYVAPGTGMARGFSEFLDLWEPFVTRRTLAAVQLYARFGPAINDKNGSVVVAEVRRWLAKRDPKVPFLVFVNLMEAHAPYQDAPLFLKFTDPALSVSEVLAIGMESNTAQWTGSRVSPEHRKTTIDLLDGAIASADAYLGEILKAVDDRTYVIALSDHGDLAGEHGLWGHLTGLYEPLIHVPLVMAGPDLPRGKTVDGLVSIVDIMPTILSLAQVPAPPADGTDLTPALRGAASPDERRIVAEHYRNSALAAWQGNRTREELVHLQARKAAVVSPTRKRVIAEDGSDLGYDLQRDPDELRPFPGSQTELAAFVPPEPALQGPVQLDPGQTEALRSLGYIK